MGMSVEGMGAPSGAPWKHRKGLTTSCNYNERMIEGFGPKIGDLASDHVSVPPEVAFAIYWTKKRDKFSEIFQDTLTGPLETKTLKIEESLFQ